MNTLGVRGMALSHLTRGAWIEIFMILSICSVNICRTSHEVRGLKYFDVLFSSVVKMSHLTRGAWIEIPVALIACCLACKSHLTRGAWIEISK